MDNQIILACDDNGKFQEYIPRMVGHTGKGIRHIGLTILLINNKGEVLSQRRKHMVFDDVWDFTASTHLLHKSHLCHSERLAKNLPRSGRIATSLTSFVPRNDKKCKICNEDNIDETLQEAAKRCMKTEYRIDEDINFKNLGHFNYFGQDGAYCENEYCFFLKGKYNGQVKMDPSVGYEYRWVNIKEFLEDVEANPQKYAPWVLEGIKILQQKGFF